jgi:hypothetical protein
VLQEFYGPKALQRNPKIALTKAKSQGNIWNTFQNSVLESPIYLPPLFPIFTHHLPSFKSNFVKFGQKFH